MKRTHTIFREDYTVMINCSELIRTVLSIVIYLYRIYTYFTFFITYASAIPVYPSAVPVQSWLELRGRLCLGMLDPALGGQLQSTDLTHSQL
jgi:hypothetical protein